MGTETRRRTIIYGYKSYVNRRLVTKEEMCGEKQFVQSLFLSQKNPADKWA